MISNTGSGELRAFAQRIERLEMERIPDTVDSSGHILGHGAQLQHIRLALKAGVVNALPPVPYSESRQVIRRLRLKEWKRKVAADKVESLRSRKRRPSVTVVKLGETPKGDATAVFVSEQF